MSGDRPTVGGEHPSGGAVAAPGAPLQPPRETTGPVTFPGPSAGEPPPGGMPPLPGPETPPPKPRHRTIVALWAAALLALGACAAGVGIGYGVFAHKTPVVTPPTTTPTTSTFTVTAVARKVDPELVDVTSTLTYETVQAEGTGMVLTPTGTVLTNNHVIEGATAIHVTDVGTGAVYSATVVGYDITADIAVLQLAGASGLQTVSFTTSSSVSVGEKVVAIGNAGGVGGTPTAAGGTVTALDQSITAEDEVSGRTEHLAGLIGTDAAIESGDSGGPLVDTAGKVIGMDTASSSGFAFSHSASEGYAIPSDTATTVDRQIRSGISSAAVHVGPTPFLGVRVVAVDQAGAAVVQVETGTPATRAGLTPGDVIDTLGGHVIHTPTTLTTVIQAYKPGTSLSLGWRAVTGVAASGKITLASGPPA